MKVSVSWLERQIACGLIAFLVVPLGEASAMVLPAVSQATATAAQSQPPADTPPVAQPPSASAGASAYPESPGAVQNQQQSASPSAPGAQQNSTQTQPVGTAVAPYVKAEGAPASRPAGAAIAPGKQRRIRTFAIRLGLLVGAGVAIGTVAAASMGSPSRPH